MNPIIDVQAARSNRGGRGLMKLASGAAALGILVAGCAPSERNTATTAPAQPVPSLAAGDMSNGADNYYTSDRVTVQKVTFKNQYQMNVTGNLFVPNDLDRNVKNAAMVVGHPMGAVKEQSANLYATKLAERGFVTMSLDLSFWGESDGKPRNLVAPEIYTEDFSAAVDYLRTQSVRRHRTHRCARHLRQRKLRRQRRQDRPAHQGRRDGEHVRHGRGQPQRIAAIRSPPSSAKTPSLRPPGSVMSSSPEGKPNTPAEHPKRSMTSRRRWNASSTTSTARPEGTAPTDHASNVEQQRAIHELLPVRRHRDDLSASHALHHRRPSPFPRVQRRGLPARRRTQATGDRSRCRPRGPLRSRQPHSLRHVDHVLSTWLGYAEVTKAPAAKG